MLPLPRVIALSLLISTACGNDIGTQPTPDARPLRSEADAGLVLDASTADAEALDATTSSDGAAADGFLYDADLVLDATLEDAVPHDASSDDAPM